jgi:hypothetical protein
MGKRTFIAKVAGVDYEIPATMGVLREATELSGTTLKAAFTEDKMDGFMLGCICAGLKRVGITEIDGVEVTYQSIEELVSFSEVQPNYMAFMEAMEPDLGPQPVAKDESGKKRKNAIAEDTTGTPSSDGATVSSS